MKMLTVGCMMLMCVSMIGCTDARWGKVTALGDSAHIECYSGEKLIYSGDSTGKVSNSDQSDGYFFKDKDTRKFMEVSGNCVITYKD